MADGAEFNEAKGAVAIVDKAVFLAAIELMKSNSLVEPFDKYLEENGHHQIILDVAFANHLKRFLAENLPTDPVARMIMMSSCGGGGGGGMRSPTGLRG